MASTRASDTSHVLSHPPPSQLIHRLTTPGKSKSPTAASFVRPTRQPDAPQSFLSALHLKYGLNPFDDQKPRRQIVFSGKVAEEIGFEKVSRQQAQLDELQFVILDDAQIASAGQPDGTGDGQRIGQVCPKVRELDLSRNLFERFGPVVDICAELRMLKSLRVKCVCPWTICLCSLRILTCDC